MRILKLTIPFQRSRHEVLNVGTDRELKQRVGLCGLSVNHIMVMIMHATTGGFTYSSGGSFEYLTFFFFFNKKKKKLFYICTSFWIKYLYKY